MQIMETKNKTRGNKATKNVGKEEQIKAVVLSVRGGPDSQKMSENHGNHIKNVSRKMYGKFVIPDVFAINSRPFWAR